MRKQDAFRMMVPSNTRLPRHVEGWQSVSLSSPLHEPTALSLTVRSAPNHNNTLTGLGDYVSRGNGVVEYPFALRSHTQNLYGNDILRNRMREVAQSYRALTVEENGDEFSILNGYNGSIIVIFPYYFLGKSDESYILRFLCKTDEPTDEPMDTIFAVLYDDMTVPIVADQPCNGTDYLEIRQPIGREGHTLRGISLYTQNTVKRSYIFSSFAIYKASEEPDSFTPYVGLETTVSLPYAFHGMPPYGATDCDVVYPLAGYADCYIQQLQMNSSLPFSPVSELSTNKPVFITELPSLSSGIGNDFISSTITPCETPEEVTGGNWRGCLSADGKYLYFSTNTMSTSLSIHASRLGTYAPKIVYHRKEMERYTFTPVSFPKLVGSSRFSVIAEANVYVKLDYLS